MKQKISKSNTAHYDLEFLHPNRASLVKLMKNSEKNEEVNFSFQDSPRKVRNENLYYVKAITSFEETGYTLLTDTLKDLTNRIKFLEVGGSFIDNYGRGYVNSFTDKEYTRYFKDKKNEPNSSSN